MDKELKDVLRGTAKSLRKACRGIERLCAMLADEPDDVIRTTNPDGTRMPIGDELPPPNEIVAAMRETDDWNECPYDNMEVRPATIGVLRRAVRELEWFVNQTPYPYWRCVKDADRAEECMSMATAIRAEASHE